MNLRRLEYFMVLAETGHIRKASEILNISAPALSKAISTLEEELETTLLVKDGRNIRLSDEGQLLFKRANSLMESVKNLKGSMLKAPTGPKPVRIATFEVFSTYFLSFLNELKWSDHALHLHETLPGELEKFVALGEVDFGITYMPVPHLDLDFMKITSIEMGVYVKAGSFEGIPQPDLPFVVPISPIQGVPNRIRGLDGWPEDAYRRKVLHEVTLMQSALELCSQGRVAGYFPCFIVNEYNNHVKEKYQLERRRTPYNGRVCKADVFLVKRKSDHESQLAKQIAKALRLICQS